MDSLMTMITRARRTVRERDAESARSFDLSYAEGVLDALRLIVNGDLSPALADVLAPPPSTDFI